MYLGRAMDANTLLYQVMHPSYMNNYPGSEVAQQRSLTPEELTSYQVNSGEYILFKTPDDGFNVYVGFLVLCKQYEGNNGEVYTSVWDVKWEAPSFSNIETIRNLPKIGMSITPF